MYNQPELFKESRLGLHQIKLNLVAGANYAHNRSEGALLHAPFRGTTLFGGELAKVYRANKECESSMTFTQQLPPSLTPLTLIGRGRSFRKGGSSYRRSGGDRDRSRSAPSSTATRPFKPGDGHATMTVTVPQEPNKRQVQTHEGAPPSKRQRNSGKHKSN